ncbi:glucosaminidase domain-containing protein [Isachenkonia alkalipeptolytica]|uniref:Uncharacterized protein n=1 Tax=Isachenkonia alkalipeptolytica TaxID=2565777 RepID=A0AA43XLW2_9CLOT|nr:glucosaminidase domain-containing protein [Isachenkonia alkalipeptolytica]NBG88876.1 hypothetical protein [Isachenkonia alkalipeptolytica]
MDTQKDLPEYFQYQSVDREGLQKCLASRDSLLKKEPYFSTIIKTSKKNGLNPLLLFAIAGHEQAFVPRSHPEAKVIANNPFNVFQSWQIYNTDIQNATEVACRTIITLSKDRPVFMNPFIWLNGRYAEDPNWWRGVEALFNRLMETQNELIPPV